MIMVTFITIYEGRTQGKDNETFFLRKAVREHSGLGQKQIGDQIKNCPSAKNDMQ